MCPIPLPELPQWAKDDIARMTMLGDAKDRVGDQVSYSEMKALVGAGNYSWAGEAYARRLWHKHWAKQDREASAKIASLTDALTHKQTVVG